MNSADFVLSDQAQLGPARIMVVDDAPENLTLVKNMLKDTGLEIFAFPSGPLALKAAERIIPDLLLLDITMPGMDGYAVCERFKADPKLNGVSIIFLSALSDTADKIRGFRAGAVDFISKPFEIEEVRVRVMTHLKLHSLQKRLEYQNEHLQELVEEKVGELTEAHRQSRKRLAEIAHMNRMITSSVFSAAISHDLRQPLAAILSNAEAAELLLQKTPPDIQQVTEILADICRDDQRASQIILRMRNLLNKKDTEIQEVDINAIIHDVLKFLAGEAKMRGVSIMTELTPALVHVLADRVQLQQVLINLILNSMDAMVALRADQRLISIETAICDATSVEVIVTDRGIGFDENIGHAFESFFTTKPQGTGMGLSISASLIHAHGGQIWAENGADCGAIVHFSLPLQIGGAA